MSARLDQIVKTVLYEGYMLYPHRPSSRKNSRERFTFGRVYPQTYSRAQGGAEPCTMQTECLLQRRPEAATLQVSVHFLQPIWREIGLLARPVPELPEGLEPEFTAVPELCLNGVRHQKWQEAVERQASISPVLLQASRWSSVRHSFRFPAARVFEPIRNEQGQVAAVLLRRQEALSGKLTIEAMPMGDWGFKITVRIVNDTALPPMELSCPDSVLLRTFASTHTILQVHDGEFISMTDPPEECKEAVGSCQNIGTWPVLVGDEAAADRATLLSSPIILHDYPQLAPESRGDFFDGTEIDEMLTLRALTMSAAEKEERRHADEFARRILERAESLPAEDFLNLHGAMRTVDEVQPLKEATL